MANKIYVGNISELTTEKDLVDLFSLSGQVISTKVVLGINQKNIGGYITMSEEADMEKAILKYNNTLLKGNRITVTRAHSIDQEGHYFPNPNSKFRRNRRF